jgi:hypothetical protein
MNAVLAIVILTLIRLVLPVGLLLIIGTLLQHRKLAAA